MSTLPSGNCPQPRQVRARVRGRHRRRTRLEPVPMSPLPDSHGLSDLLIDEVKDYAIYMLDTSGNVQTWNKGAQIITGYSPDEIRGRHFSIFYTAEDLASGKPAHEIDTAR